MAMQLDAARQRLYMSTGRGGTVAVIRPRGARRSWSAEVPVGKRPWGIALSADGKQALFRQRSLR